MAKFEISYKITCEKEGGYCNDPRDSGGETIFGISRNYHPSWGGWGIVEQKKLFCLEEEGSRAYNEEITEYCKEDESLERLKLEFYKKTFWDILNLDKVKSQKIANALFDASVNHGAGDSGKMAQKALGIEVDGIIGSKSIEAINEASEHSFLRSFCTLRREHYFDIVKNNPTQQVFLNGWLSRADSFK